MIKLKKYNEIKAIGKKRKRKWHENGLVEFLECEA
jgi:hypothetical protein